MTAMTTLTVAGCSSLREAAFTSYKTLLQDTPWERPVNAILVGVFLLFFAGNAWASKPYPPEIRKWATLDKDPGCDLCHRSASGGDPISKPFGIWLRRNGVIAVEKGGSIALLDRALAMS